MRVAVLGNAVGLSEDGAGEANVVVQAISQRVLGRGHEVQVADPDVLFRVGVLPPSTELDQPGVFIWEIESGAHPLSSEITTHVNWRAFDGTGVDSMIADRSTGMSLVDEFMERAEAALADATPSNTHQEQVKTAVLVDYLGWILDRRREELIELLAQVMGERDRALERVAVLERELDSLRQASREPDDQHRRRLTGSVATVIVAVLAMVGGLGAAAINADAQRDAARISAEATESGASQSGPTITQTVELAQELVDLCGSPGAPQAGQP